MPKKSLISLAAALLTIAVPAFAGTFPQTQHFSGIPNTSGTLTFNQFDNNSGTWVLQSIQLSFTLESSGGRFILDNDNDFAVSGTFEFGSKGTISSTNVVLKDSSSQPIPGQADAYHSEAFSLASNVGDGEGDYSPAPPDGLLYNGRIETSIKSGFVGSNFWTDGTKGFLGTGTYDIDYSIIRWGEHNGLGQIEFALTPPSVNGLLTVVYTYDVIPEPATITLLAVGAFSLLKRRSSK